MRCPRSVSHDASPDGAIRVMMRGRVDVNRSHGIVVTQSPVSLKRKREGVLRFGIFNECDL